MNGTFDFIKTFIASEQKEKKMNNYLTKEIIWYFGRPHGFFPCIVALKDKTEYCFTIYAMVQGDEIYSIVNNILIKPEKYEIYAWADLPDAPQEKSNANND